MDKSTRILNLVGYVIEILAAAFFIFLFVISIIIATPGSKDFIARGLADGTISRIETMTIEENVSYLQGIFVVFSILVFIIAGIFVIESVIAILIGRKAWNKNLLIASLILSIFSINIFLIVGDILLLKQGEVETIEVS